VNDFQGAGPTHSKGTFPLESTVKNWGVAVTAQYDVRDYLTVKSIISHRTLEWTGKRDADNTPFTILHTDIDSDGEFLTAELQGLFRFDNIYGVVGLYYGEEDVDEDFTVQQGPPPTGFRELSNDVDVRNENWAIFSEWTYNVNQALSLTGGFRYTEETKGVIPDLYRFDIPDVKLIPVKLYEKDFESFTGSASIAYRWNESIMTYFSWSQGFKGGGFNSRVEGLAIGATEPPPFDEETAETFEIGFKSDFFNRTLRLNGSFFTTDYDDLQFSFRIGAAPVIFNAGKASIDGFELDFTWVPNANFTVEGGVGYLDASIDEVADIVGASTTVTTDNTLAYTPEWSANIGVAYTLNVFGSISATPRIDAIYQDSFFVDTANTVEIAQTSSYTLLNASVMFDSDQGAWSIMAGVNNLTDERYVVAGNSSLTSGAGYAEVAYGRTREWFVKFRYAF
jgi:iron complex outermembrane receptor protein